MPDEFLDLLEEARAVGLVFVRHELTRRRLVFYLLLGLHLASVPTRQLLPPRSVVVGLRASSGVGARTAETVVRLGARV
jgi:hypothetical protein